MSRSDPRRGVPTGMFGIAVLAVLAALCSGGAFREMAFDAMLRAMAPLDHSGVAVVAIDNAALAAVGSWPWPRDRLGALIDRLAADHPRAIVLDMVMAGEARRGTADDPDEVLRSAIARNPVVLGALLGGTEGGEGVGLGPEPPPPLLLSGEPAALSLWGAEAATWPLARLAEGAAGVGIASLAGDHRGTVREVPLLVAIGGTVYPGLAAEAVRVAEGASGYIIAGGGPFDGFSGRVDIGEISVRMSRDGTARFVPSDEVAWVERTVSAGEVLVGRIAPGRFAGQIVLVGGTAPQLGTLRPTAASPVTPGVQINADAVTAILSGTAPLRPALAPWLEAVARAVMAVAGVFLGWRLAPGRSLLFAGVAGTLWVLACLGFMHGPRWLVDPVSPSAVLIAAAVLSAIARAVAVRRRAGVVVARFRQYLAPEIVDRILRQPDLSRVEGQRRMVTFLFTDIEGFTAMSAVLPPETVVALLDDYFQGVTDLIVRSGGTVAKYVGDAMHAMFNAPDDLPDHATCAVTAAERISRFTEEFRLRPEVAALGLGRTRIGVETGEVIVGDVGGGPRFDYTAHGVAISTAARLEALNARLGTLICVGPVARAAIPTRRFASRGIHDLKGLGAIEVFELLPD